MDNAELLLNRLLKIREKDPNYISGYFLDYLDDHGQPTPLKLADWIEKAKEIAFALRQCGVGPGDRVIISLPTSEEFLISFLALWWIGAIPVPLPEPSPFIKKASFQERLQHVIKDCSPKGIIVLDFGQEILSGIEGLKILFSSFPIWSWGSLLKRGMEKIENPLAPRDDHIAFIQYTSGSTGAPKGVIVTQHNLKSNMQASGEACSASKNDSFVSWIPLYHDMGLIGSVLWTIYWQMPFYLMSPLSFLADPSAWIKNISRFKATLSIGPNFAYNLCAKRLRPEEMPGLDLSKWRLAFNGSEPIDHEGLTAFFDKFSPYGFKNKVFYPVYGMAEATLAISFPKPGTEIRIDKITRKDLNERNLAVNNTGTDDVIVAVSVGYPLPGHTVKIKEPSGNTIRGEREVGEICFYGPSVTPGYFHEHHSLISREELRTGDLGYFAEGNLFVVDRIKDLIQIAGVNYYPTDIERYIQKVPRIKPGRVIAFGLLSGQTGTETLIVVAEIEKSSDQNELKRKIRERLIEGFGISPLDIYLSEEKIIPLTSSGKLMRKKCKDFYVHAKR